VSELEKSSVTSKNVSKRTLSRSDSKMLIHLLLDRARRPETFEELFAQVSRSLGSYSVTSIAEATLRALRIGRGDKLENLKAAPWLSCVLLKWRLQLDNRPVSRGPAIPQPEYDRLRQALWDLNTLDEAKRDPKTVLNVMTWLRSALIPQAEFQKSLRADFFRWPVLVAALHSTHVIRKYFREDIGMEPEAYVDLAIATIAAAEKHPDGFSVGWFDALRSAYGESVDQFLALFSRNLDGLRVDVTADRFHTTRRRSELHEFPFLKRHPLLRVHGDSFISWHPSILRYGMDEAVHLRLSDRSGQYAQPFGAVFEEYVCRLLDEAGISYVPEMELKAMAGTQESVVEAFVEAGPANVFIEAKMGLFADIPLAREDPRNLRNRLEPVLRAFSQGWSMSRLARSGKLGGRGITAERDYLLVVTSRELYVGGGLSLHGMLEPVGVAYPSEDCRKWMPLENMFVIGIDQFELLLACVGAIKRPLIEILETAARANREGATSRLIFFDHLPRFEMDRFPSLLVQDAKLRALRRVGTALGAMPEDLGV
jgi:hypothetical protein